MTAARPIPLVMLLAASALTPAWALTPTVPDAPIVQPVEPVVRPADARRPTICTEQYAPVCGRINGIARTYSNRCFARAAGAEVIADGPCGPAGNETMNLLAPRDRTARARRPRSL